MTEPEQGSKRPKGRSPSYPALHLEAAIQRARQLYERERQHATPAETIARHWGYKSLNGPAALSLAALKKFGLLADERTGTTRRGQLTDLAVEILANPDPQARQRAIQRAALNPAIHKELWEKYGDASGISDENLHWELTRERKFTETGADEFIPEYRATVAFAQLSKSATVLPQEQPGPEDGQDGDVGEDDEDQGEDEPDKPLRNRRTLRVTTDAATTYAVPVAAGQDVVIEGKFPLSEQEWRQFLAVLTAMKPALVTDAQDDGDG